MSSTPSHGFVPNSNADSMKVKELGPAFSVSRTTKEEQDEFNAIESEVRESKQERTFIDYVATRLASVKEMLETDKQRGMTELPEFEKVYDTISTRLKEARKGCEPAFGSGSLAKETIREEGPKTHLSMMCESRSLMCGASTTDAIV